MFCVKLIIKFKSVDVGVEMISPIVTYVLANYCEDGPVKSTSMTVLSARRVINVRGVIAVDQNVANENYAIPAVSA